MNSNFFTRLLLCLCALTWIGHSAQAQKTIYSNDFETMTEQFLLSGPLNDTIGGGGNIWNINNVYVGVDGNDNVPSQVNATGGSIDNPDQRYLHVLNRTWLATNNSQNAIYNPSEPSSNFAFTNLNSICTGDLRNVAVSFFWTCMGSDLAWGEVYYSINEGPWVIAPRQDGSTRYNNQDGWTKETISLPTFTRVNSLRIGFRWLNFDDQGGISQIGFCVDDLKVVGNEIQANQFQIIPDNNGVAAVCAGDRFGLRISHIQGYCAAADYTIELSDATGGFTNPAWTKDYTDTERWGIDPYTKNAFWIEALDIPSDIPTGVCYKWRVTRHDETYGDIVGVTSNCLQINECPPILNTLAPPAVSFAVNAGICAGSHLEVPVLAAGRIFPANEYVVQLSDANGDFAAAVEIGRIADPLLHPNVDDTQPGYIAAHLPLTTLPGCSYRVRVNSTAPRGEGTPSQSFCIRTCDIITNTETPLELCLNYDQGRQVNVPYEIHHKDPNIVYNASNKFVLNVLDRLTLKPVLSNVSLFSVQSSQSGVLALNLPDFNQLALQTGLKQGSYFARIEADGTSDPTVSDGTLIPFRVGAVIRTIQASLVDSVFCLDNPTLADGASFRILNPVAGVSYVIYAEDLKRRDTVTAAATDVARGYMELLFGRELNSQKENETFNLCISALSQFSWCTSEPTCITFKYIKCNILFNDPVSVGKPGEMAPICQGSAFDVLFQSYGQYNGNNDYVVELSDVSGTFTTPTTICKRTADGVAHVDLARIPGAIPESAAPGCNYFIRVSSTSPIKTSAKIYGPFCIAECDVRIPVTDTVDGPQMQLCVDDFTRAVSIPFTVSNRKSPTGYKPGNTFRAELRTLLDYTLLTPNLIGTVTAVTDDTVKVVFPDWATTINGMQIRPGTWMYLRLRADGPVNHLEDTLSAQIRFAYNPISTNPEMTFVDTDPSHRGASQLFTQFTGVLDSAVLQFRNRQTGILEDRVVASHPVLELCDDEGVAAMFLAIHPYDQARRSRFGFMSIPSLSQLTPIDIDRINQEIEDAWAIGRWGPDVIAVCADYYTQQGQGNFSIFPYTYNEIDERMPADSNRSAAVLWLGLDGNDPNTPPFLKSSNFIYFGVYEANGNCHSRASNFIEIRVNHAPTAKLFTKIKSKVCIGDTMNLLAQTNAGVSNHWSLARDGVVQFSNIPGAKVNLDSINNENQVQRSDEERFFLNTKIKGQYQLVLHAESKCGAKDTTISFEVVDKPDLQVLDDSVSVCKGESVKLEAVNCNDYTWSPQTGLNVFKGQQVQCTPAPDVTAQTYTVTGSLTVGGECTATKTVHVTVNPRPLKPTVTFPNKTFTASGILTGETREWFLGDNDLGVSEIELPKTGDDYASGDYTVVVTNEFGCKNTSDIFTYKGVGIMDLKQVSSFTVAPNPFQGSTTIRYELTQPSNVTIEVYDLTGKRIRTLADGKQNGGVHSYEFSSGSQAAGVYVLKVTVDGETQAFRLLQAD